MKGLAVQPVQNQVYPNSVNKREREKKIAQKYKKTVNSNALNFQVKENKENQMQQREKKCND